jgi:ribosomal-protein-alanine N-acetyltransferase
MERRVTSIDMRVRAGTGTDLEAIRGIQRRTPDAAQWAAGNDELLVAEMDGAAAGFLEWRRTAPDEVEILNLAVDPGWRRRGVARALLEALPKGRAFLEVRESNQAARALYHSVGYEEIGVRAGYYNDPPERGIVMRWQS